MKRLRYVSEPFYYCCRMKQVMVAILVLTLSGSFLHQSYLCLDFVVNQAAIAEEHCENKDEPVLKYNCKSINLQLDVRPPKIMILDWLHIG